LALYAGPHRLIDVLKGIIRLPYHGNILQYVLNITVADILGD